VKLQGAHTLAAPRQAVWELLTDPERLAKCLPGCEKLETVGPDKYRVAIKFVLAAFSNSYAGGVELSEKKPPVSLRMKVEGKGGPGFMRGEGTLTLKENKTGTEVQYAGEAQVGGLIAAVGQRMIEAAARRIIGQFFESAEEQLRG
jgi:carbon monoxide dehydrogenase subunit G